MHLSVNGIAVCLSLSFSLTSPSHSICMEKEMVLKENERIRLLEYLKILLKSKRRNAQKRNRNAHTIGIMKDRESTRVEMNRGDGGVVVGHLAADIVSTCHG